MVSSGLDATIAVSSVYLPSVRTQAVEPVVITFLPFPQAFAALAESGSPATASLYASHPWWVRGQDCAAFVRGLFAKGPGVDALAAIWTDPTFGFAERERVHHASLRHLYCCRDPIDSSNGLAAGCGQELFKDRPRLFPQAAPVPSTDGRVEC